MQTFIFILELIGTIAFAVSGALTALKKNMDIFGVSILGLTTACGGGVTRDLLLGITPPTMFHDPVYALVAVSVSIIVFCPSIRRFLTHNHLLYDRMMLVLDSIGLGIFTVSGVNTAANATETYNVFLFIFVGVITGVGGGLLRDMMAGNTPYIFVKHVYACASGVGAILCVLLLPHTDAAIAMFSGAAAVFVIRLLAAHYKWSLPHASDQ